MCPKVGEGSRGGDDGTLTLEVDRPIGDNPGPVFLTCHRDAGMQAIAPVEANGVFSISSSDGLHRYLRVHGEITPDLQVHVSDYKYVARGHAPGTVSVSDWTVFTNIKMAESAVGVLGEDCDVNSSHPDFVVVSYPLWQSAFCPACYRTFGGASCYFNPGVTGSFACVLESESERYQMPSASSPNSCTSPFEYVNMDQVGLTGCSDGHWNTGICVSD